MMPPSIAFHSLTVIQKKIDMEKITRFGILMDSDIKIEVILNNLPVGKTMADIDFSVVFSTANGSLPLAKKDLYAIVDGDDTRYVACFNSSKVGKGDVIMTVTANIPDEGFEGGFRKDVVKADTKVTVL